VRTAKQCAKKEARTGGGLRGVGNIQNGVTGLQQGGGEGAVTIISTRETRKRKANTIGGGRENNVY